MQQGRFRASGMVTHHHHTPSTLLSLILDYRTGGSFLASRRGSLFPSAEAIPVVSRVAEARPPIAPKTATNTPNPVRRRHAAAHRKTQTANWAVAEPAIQIAIPGDAMFPPGAVPEGVNFVANLSLADGSVQGLRLQP